MKTNRLEAFSDGVIAIIITIMVIELKAPHEPTLTALFKLWPTFLSYLLSFIIIAIYWVNHHHLIQLAKKVDGYVLWANIHLLFWMSLIPFVTAYLGETHGNRLSVSLYASVKLTSALAYYLLRTSIAAQHRTDKTASRLHQNMRHKNLIAIIIYALAVLCSLVWITGALILVTLPAIMYFIPDKNVEIFADQHI
ncbi:MAG: TMEM175 family protein [Verrucomicrobiae bacterium]|nr:TMEM175 family protein [Verrucomicrobiae bacterium]